MWPKSTRNLWAACLRLLRLETTHLFKTPEDVIDMAYGLQAEKIAYELEQVRLVIAGLTAMKLLTIGFTKKSAEDFFTRLRDSEARRVLDVRLNNVSQLAGFSKRDDLCFFLRELCQMDYHHFPELAPTAEMLAAYEGERQ